MKYGYYMPPKFAGLKLLRYSRQSQQPGVCTASLSLSQQGVNVTKMENFLLQENGYWPNKVIISSTPHATHTCQEYGFHACRRMLVWLATGTGLSQPGLCGSRPHVPTPLASALLAPALPQRSPELSHHHQRKKKQASSLLGGAFHTRGPYHLR